MAVAFYPPDKRRRDEDNLLKALQDAMQVGGCYEDDWYIERRILDRVHEYLGKVVVRLSSLDAAKKAVEDLSK
jgi:Holliday junction resolvase RusA-like endonuclease